MIPAIKSSGYFFEIGVNIEKMKEYGTQLILDL